MLSIPVFFVGSVVVSVITSEVKLNIERQGYNNCIDKWKNDGCNESVRACQLSKTME